MARLSPQFRATLAVRARKVRAYLIAHAGSTNDEVIAATGEGLSYLQSKGLAYWKRGEDGKARWYACSPKPPKPKGWDWRWNPDKLHWEHGDEVAETKWEKYGG